MAVFTFIDTVVESDACMPGEGDEATSIRFHELVHTEQFRQLGIDKTIALYLRQWTNSEFNYWDIGLEQDAKELELDFESNPEDGFSVRNEVARQIEAYKFL